MHFKMCLTTSIYKMSMHTKSTCQYTMTGAYTPQCTVQSSNSERSKVPTRVLFALAWLPKYFKNVTLDHQSTTDYPNSVFFFFFRLLTCSAIKYIRPCNAPFCFSGSTCTYSIPLKNCAPLSLLWPQFYHHRNRG